MGLEMSHGLVLATLHPVLLLYFMIITTVLDTRLVMSAVPSGQSTCDLSNCLDLFQAAQESLQIRYDYPVPRHHTLSPEDIQVRCIALRTFFHCLQNLSSQCHGDLGFHSSKKVIERQMKQLNCTASGPVFEPQHFPHPKEPNHPAICSFSGSLTLHYCSIFGDPHLRTFSGLFQTCRIHGAWPLVDNEFFSVQVTSEAVGLGAATAITKVTVVVKRHDDCAHEHYVTYQAMSPDLPSIFDDGQTSFGPSDSVHLTEVVPNRHVEIRLHYINTLLVLRQDGRFLSVGILMPEELSNRSVRERSNALQLCSLGCSSSEQIHVAQLFRDTKRLSSSSSSPLSQSSPSGHSALEISRAEQLCRGLTDNFLDSCAFDVLTTGDLNSTEPAFHAYNDAIRLYPEIRNELPNRTRLLRWMQGASVPPVLPAASACSSSGYNCYLLVIMLSTFHFLVNSQTFLLCIRQIHQF